jgi:hypothetical protein
MNLQRSNREILEEEYREHWENWQLIQYVDMTMADRNRLHRIVQEEWGPPIAFHDWCGKCVIEYLKYAFDRLNEEKQNQQI